MVREEIGPVGGAAALVGVLAIMVILIAVLGLVVVNAMFGSPWGTFTVAATIPIALLMGVYMVRLRPGRVLEATARRRRARAPRRLRGRLGARAPDARARSSPRQADASRSRSSSTASSRACSRSGCCSRRATTSRPSSRSARCSLLAAGLLWVRPDVQLPAITQFVDGTGPGLRRASSSRSASSRSPAARSPGSTR